MAAKFTKGRKIVAAITAVLVLVSIGLIVLFFDRGPSDMFAVSSCANHVSQLKSALRDFGEVATNFPTETDTRKAFLAMAATIGQRDHWTVSGLPSCPEAFFKDGSIGYVFVGDGLPTKLAEETGALLLFCPADSHQRSQQHSHAVVIDYSMSCVMSNAAMMAILSRELERAKDGIVPYSTNAVARMRQELNARQVHETRRRGTKDKGA